MGRDAVNAYSNNLKSLGYTCTMDQWVFDFDRSGDMSNNEFRAAYLTMLNSKQENFEIFFRHCPEVTEQSHEAWKASGLKEHWMMTKEELELVLNLMSEQLTQSFFKNDVPGCLAKYSTHGSATQELSM